MNTRITVLGCGGSAGVPMIGGVGGAGDWGVCDPHEPRNRRSRSSIVIEQNNRRLLVDTSPEMRGQLLACNIPGVDAILYTHAHADHITGLDDVRVLNRIAGRPLDAIGTAATLSELARRFDYAFRPWTPPFFYGPVLQARPIVPGAVDILGMATQIFTQAHGRVTTLGLRIADFAYSTDVLELDPAALAVLSGVRTWVVGCFQRTPHNTHASLPQILAWSAAIGCERTVLTHMGPDMDWAWLKANLPPGVEPAFDGLTLAL